MLKEYFIRKSSLAPVRYQIYQEDRPLFSLGVMAAKKFFPELQISTEKINISEWIDQSPNYLEELKRFETQILEEEMFAYLARQETSPAKLDRWLMQRRVGGEKRKEWIIQAKEKNFLNLERYIEKVVEGKKRAGHPWAQVRRKLDWELSPYRYLLAPELDWEEMLSNYVYDDLEVLIEYFKFPSRFLNHSEKLKRYLITKGFTHSTVKEYLDRLRI